MSNFNSIQLATFGEMVEIKTTSPFTIKAIVEPDTHIEHLQQVQINHQSLLIYIDETLLQNKGVERRQTMTVRGKDYSISEIGNDMNGLAVFRVSRI